MALIVFVTVTIFLVCQTIKYKILGDTAKLNFLLLCVYNIIGGDLALLVLAIKGQDLACLWNSVFLYGVKFNGMCLKFYNVRVNEVATM